MQVMEYETVAARLDALKLAVEHLFKGTPGGMKAREEFIDALQALAQTDYAQPERRQALQAELPTWKPPSR